MRVGTVAVVCFGYCLHARVPSIRSEVESAPCGRTGNVPANNQRHQHTNKRVQRQQKVVGDSRAEVSATENT